MARHNAHPTSAQAVDLLVRTLGRHSTLSIRDERAIRKLHPRVTSAARDEDIVCQGDHPKVAVMVISGMLARYHTTEGGERQYLSLHIAGDLPDLQSLFLGIMDHSLVALNDAQVAWLRHEDLYRLTEDEPQIGFALWRQTLIDAAIFR